MPNWAWLLLGIAIGWLTTCLLFGLSEGKGRIARFLQPLTRNRESQAENQTPEEQNRVPK